MENTQILEKTTYNHNEIIETMNSLRRVFDIVRVVDPIEAKEYIFNDDGTMTIDEYHCYAVWLKEDRCKNCISSRCVADKNRRTKFEFVNNDIYYVVGQYITVNDIPLVLEIVSNVSDKIMLEALGENDFVEKISKFNEAIYTDSLTGLSNRRYMDEQLYIANQTAIANKLSISVAMLDIDNFKGINDTHGHATGDIVISALGETLKSNFSSARGDIVARYGGDEFFLCAVGMSKEIFEERLKKIIDIIRDVCVIPFSISIGAFHQPIAKETNIQTIMKKADDTLYDVKKNGKNAFFITTSIE